MKHKATAARIHQATGRLCSVADRAARPSSAILPGVCTEGGAWMRENKPLLRTEGGAGDPREGVPNASHHSPGTPRGRRGLHSQTGRTIAACLDPGRPGLGLPPAPQARVVSAPPAPARPRLGPRPAARAEPRPGRACNPGPARPPLPRPHVHSRAGGARSPGAVAALAHSATLLAARPRDTRTAPARPGPG